MSILVYAVATPPAAPPPNPWKGLEMHWYGWDGSVWSLTNPDQGSVMLPGVRGLTMPPVTHYTDQYASVAGSRWRGYNITAREAFWPIQIFHNTSSQDWLNRDRAWWKTMRPGHTGQWSVVQPSGEERRLTLRFKDDGTQQFDTDPAAMGWTNYGITLTAEQPFWAGTRIDRTFRGGVAQPFYIPSGTPKTVAISPSTTGSLTLSNNGDEPVWPTWYIDGPASGFSVGYGSNLIEGTVSIGSGQTLVIETDPVKRSATLAGTNVMTSLTAKNFAPFPAGDLVTVAANAAGGGAVRYSFVPLYHRAW